MANYYELVAGLPELRVDQSSVPISSDKYLDILEKTLTNGDKKLLDTIRLDSTVRNIEKLVFGNNVVPVDMSERDSDDCNIPVLNIEMNDICHRAKNKIPLTDKYVAVPSFLMSIIYRIYSDENLEIHKNLSVVHDIYTAYYETAQKSDNEFISEWFSFNKNIKNIISLFVCEKLGWEPADFILGNLPLDERIRTSKTNNLNDIEELDYINDVVSIAKESDITKRERQIDLIKWKFLDKYNYDDVFGIENVICYYIKLCILERWINLNKEQGELKFRSIVAKLKETTKISLQEFKNKQRK